MTCLSNVTLGEYVLPVETWNPSKVAGDDEFPYIDLSAIDQERKQIVEARSTACAEAPSRARQLVETGDVLISTVRPNLNGVARVGVQHHRATASTGFCVLRAAAGKLDGGYAFQWVKSPAFVSDMVSKATGASYPAVSDRIVLESKIPLPPLPEQRRIAAILDQADALRAKRREALAQLDSLTQSIFIEMFGDPATNPRGWPEVTVAELCEVKGGKRLPKGADYAAAPTPFRYIRVTDIRSGAVDETKLVYLKPEVQTTISRYTVNTDDVIISIAGSIGLIAPVPPSLAGANLTENAAKLVPRADAPSYDPVFLAKALQTPFAQDQIASHVGQVTIGKLALFRIEKVRLPLPPIDGQRRFARSVEAVARLRRTHEASHKETDALFASLQHRAFSGGL